MDTKKETMMFAGIEWRVLDKQENKILLIAKRIIGNRFYDMASNDWKNCDLRRFLNEDLFPKLCVNDQNKIIEHYTGDKIFLLSQEEVNEYFVSDRDTRAFDSNGTATFWWLRSPGSASNRASKVNEVGLFNLHGYDISNTGGVRPALWIKVNP